MADRQRTQSGFFGMTLSISLALALILLMLSCSRPQGEQGFKSSFKAAAKLEDKGRYWQAVGAYRELLADELTDSSRINVLFRLGDCYRKTGNYVLAEKIYQIVVDEYHEEIYRELAYGRLVDCYREAGRYRDALRMFPLLIEITSEDILLASIYFDQGRTQLKLRDRAAAWRSYRKAIQYCREVEGKHRGGDFASYASQIREEVEEAMRKIDR